jgi:hypothetical protein
MRRATGLIWRSLLVAGMTLSLTACVKRPLPPALQLEPTDSAMVTLSNGVDVACDGNALPVVFEISKGIVKSNGALAPLKSGKLLTAAAGSCTDGRVLFRFSELNATLPDDSHYSLPVDGWIVGTDRLSGMPGRLISGGGKQLIRIKAGVTGTAVFTKAKAN